MEGELSIVASSNGHGMVVLLRVDQSVTVLSTSGRFDESEVELAKRMVANRPISASLHELFRERLENSEVVATVWDLVSQRVSQAMKDLFGPLATLNAKDADWREAFSELLRKGLFGMLGQDEELTRAVAAFGLANTISTDLTLVQGICKVLDVDDEAVEEAINLSTSHGLPLIVRKENSVFALV